MTAEPHPAGGPTSAPERIVSLDVLRGFALFGVLLTNAFVSARPFQEALAAPVSELGTSVPWAEVLGWGLFETFLVMKFVALFSLLFGMGLVLQTRRAEQSGQAVRGLYLRRLGLLGAIGLLHGCLLFEGDILLPYAFFGLFLFALRRASPGRLTLLALVLFLIGVTLSLALSHLLAGGSLPIDEDALRVDEARRNGPFSVVLANRPIDYLGWLVISSLTSFNWRVMALFLVGAAVMKLGLLGPSHARLHRRTALVGWSVGGVLQLGSTMLAFHAPDAVPPLSYLGVLADEVGSLLLSAGYAGTVLWAVGAGWCQPLQRGLAAVGRTALTNYLLQSVFLNLVFMPIGLGLYDRLDHSQVLLLFTLVFAFQIVSSLRWMEVFKLGPCEWAWRCATYGRRLPIRR